MRKQELHPRTAVINKKQKNLSKQARLKALSWLASEFPQAFNNTICIRPLSIGIMADLLKHADKAEQAGISKSKLREAVVLFTRRIDYLTCLKAREMRVDLYGNAVAQVTEEEANLAAAKIKKRVEKCAKNARRTAVSHPPVAKSSQTVTPQSVPMTTNLDNSSYYTERAPLFSMQNNASSAHRATSVTVTHKSSRQYDPDAVARLKEKLGLSRPSTETDKADDALNG